MAFAAESLARGRDAIPRNNGCAGLSRVANAVTNDHRALTTEQSGRSAVNGVVGRELAIADSSVAVRDGRV